MKYLAMHESKTRGFEGFPFEFYHLNSTHPRYQMPFHWQNEFELIRVKKGEFSLTVDDKNYKMHEDDCILIIDGSIHGGVAKNAIYECVVFDFNDICSKQKEFLSVLPTLDNLEHGSVIIENGTKISETAHKIFDLFSKNNLELYDKIQVIGCTFELIGKIIESSISLSSNMENAKKLSNIKRVFGYIKQNYSQYITLEQLAEMAGLNPKYFCEVFKEYTGKTPIDYLIYYRIECACEQLLMTDNNITEVAFSCGFNDVSYFSKKFRLLKNISPSKFRTQNR